ncbi:MAG: hypothetical protein R8M45_09610 [Ghiorsea sp.]
MIETRLGNLENDVAVIKATMATKDDIHHLQETMNEKLSGLHVQISENQTTNIRWFIITGVAIASVVGAIAIGIANILVKALGAG